MQYWLKSIAGSKVNVIGREYGPFDTRQGAIDFALRKGHIAEGDGALYCLLSPLGFVRFVVGEADDIGKMESPEILPDWPTYPTTKS